MERKRGPGILVPPPAIFLVAFLVGAWLDVAMFRIPIAESESRRVLVLTGTALLIIGAAGAAWGALSFRSHNTSVLPFRAATALVQDGPYRFTRNPMYLGMAIGYIGGALAVNSMWPIILLPMALVALYTIVIKREERHLAENFGAEYAEYTRRVRRWL